ncbi:restriction endonuclease subunit S [Citrobacter freundii]|jgi:type I restriction enzyme S subunit|uniref:restriction endonuclease subunit S n=1 Tax=Citrobacter freundii TaxID=546 RepID=UPI0015E9C947|nr:restriction endonuclease subunit S [Citrobacter freundii]QLY68141.1 restriction endonuclease subunit S [Citrobacter freundii]
MGSKWKQTTLGDLALGFDGAVDGPFGSNLPASAYTESGYPIIRGSNLSIGLDDFKDSDFVFVPEHIFQKLSRSECRADDIIFTKKGTLGQTGLISTKHRFEKYLLSSNQMRLRVDPDKALPEYVYYYVSSQKAINKIIQDSECTGVPKINLAYLKSFPISLPSLSEQKDIIDILGSLNRKITLNRQINQTLEQMSQTLFKSWFVDFDPVIDNALDAGNPIPEVLQSRAELRQKVRNSADFKPLPADIRALFPAEFEETELGWVPKGWQPKSMHDLVESVSITYPLSKTDKVIFLNTGDIEKGSFLHQNYSKTEGLPGQAKKSIKKGDILFSEIRPENKRYAFVHFESDDYVVSTKLMVLRAKNEINPLLPYFIITLEDNTKKLQRVAELRSGTFPQITFKELEFISFTMPNNDKIMELFINSYLTPAYNKIIATKKANMNLINLRDTLLPKLISGELSLEDLPDLVDQTEPA